MFLDGEKTLEFKLNFKVTKSVKKGFLNLRTSKEELVILDNVKGKIESGTLTAILGASGCGKTSLLAGLSQRLRGNLNADITFDGKTIDRNKMTNISGFVPQSNVLVEGLTVCEHFYFMIELKLPTISFYEKEYLVESSLLKFGLDGNTKLKHLSGGEKRKLSLACELLTKPEILFCDEPTSGLDSYNAYAVVNTLRELAGFVNEPKLFKRHTTPSKIVLFSIHQPTSDIYHLFTNIILMNSGKIVFHGTIREAQTLFTSMGYICPTHYNPAEFYINIISDPIKSEEILNYTNRKLKFDMGGNLSSQCSSESTDDLSLSKRKVSWFRQVWLLSHRSILNFRRDNKHYLIELLIFTLFATAISSAYSNVSLDSDKSVQDINGLLIILATEALFTFTYAVLFSIFSELPLLRKETGDRLYSLSAYYVSLTLIMIPRIIFETFLFTAIIYFPANIGRDFSTFLLISIDIMMSGLSAMSYGFFLSGLFESIFIVTELSGIVDLVLLLVAGIYINVKFVSWLKYLSFFFYANETISIHFWRTIDVIKCNPNPEIACFSNGTAVLESLGFGTDIADVYLDYVYQFILTILMHVLAFIGIRRNVTKAGFY